MNTTKLPQLRRLLKAVHHRSRTFLKRQLLEKEQMLAPPPQAPAWKKRFRHVMILDTSVASDNLGDQIIVQAVQKHLLETFRDAFVTTSSSHDGMGPFSLRNIKTADLVLLTGTNALSAEYHVDAPFIWNVRAEHLELLKNKVVLVGVGANRHADSCDHRQLAFLNHVLSKDFVHSTRDTTGTWLVEHAGHRALNTACPSLWSMDEATLGIPEKKSDAVCFTLTMHRPDPVDADFIRILKQNYGRCYFWPQQPRDLDYLEDIAGFEGITILPPSLYRYDELLQREAVDVIGTRLHGTIRGLQHGRRSIVITVDNRARELAAATDLPTLERPDLVTLLPQLIHAPSKTRIQLPKTHIQTFLSQFIEIG